MSRRGKKSAQQKEAQTPRQKESGMRRDAEKTAGGREEKGRVGERKARSTWSRSRRERKRGESAVNPVAFSEEERQECLGFAVFGPREMKTHRKLLPYLVEVDGDGSWKPGIGPWLKERLAFAGSRRRATLRPRWKIFLEAMAMQLCSSEGAVDKLTWSDVDVKVDRWSAESGGRLDRLTSCCWEKKEPSSGSERSMG